MNCAPKLWRSAVHAPAYLTNSPELRLLLNRATYMCGVRVIRALLSSGFSEMAVSFITFTFTEP
ncbi:hypothetical protein BCD64_11945 [Nostoc sp. MBR 210]|nr:hypothetical protein BCD64_11945 [Nostoc sp. MBR 210]